MTTGPITKIEIKLRFARITCALFLAVWTIGTTPADAQLFESDASHVYLVDFQTGDVLVNKNGDATMAPASMTKMMTVYLLFERLKDGSLSLEDTFRVSEKAWRKGGSKMYVDVGSRVKVEDLLRGIVVQSGNDASIVIAEGLAGSEDAFAAEMNRAAHDLGMTNTTFFNASGWPHPEHVTTAHDLAVLATATIRNFPEFYHYYSENLFKYNGIEQYNRNPLLRKEMGADGLKTGHTEASGYGIVASAMRNDRRLILILNGLSSESGRSSESERILDLGFREWGNYTLFKAGDVVASANIWLGNVDTVPLVIEQDVTLTLRRRARREMVVKVLHEDPIPAPISKGARIAKVVVTTPQTGPQMGALELPLVAGNNIGRLGMVGRFGAAMNYILWGDEATQ
jgi:serine-type D-Ala-D-Ala carboxypeptidase (penicillin-binding protein 5/6)